MSKVVASKSRKNTRTRYRLHARQGGLCHYCKGPIGILMTQKGNPVLEHYIPQSTGGRVVVLACAWCDKKKGMIPGPEFEQIVAEFGLVGKINTERNVIQSAMGAECKRRNRILFAEHPPNLFGQALSISRYQQQQELVVEVIPVPMPMACDGT